MPVATEVPTLRLTTVFRDNARAYRDGYRRVLNEGGTSSSKTWSILQLLMLIAQGSKEKILISVVSESLPHLKRGAMRDFFKIVNESPDNNPRFNKTENTYVYEKAQIEFFGADDEAKVRGPRRDILFINEANNISWETARGLDIRTAKFTLADWNPVGEFWVHRNWIGEKENVYIHSTYQDALQVLPQQVVDKIESNKDKDPNWWNIYGLGLVGKVEGLVYPKFEQVDELPMGEYFYGLDFGFLVDPSVLVRNVLLGDKLYSQELFYEAGLTNDQIARKMEMLGVRHHSDRIFADPDEPKSIEEIAQMGFNIVESVKGPGSVAFSHQKVNQCYQFWTKDSVTCIKEQRNFRYIKDKEGILTERTAHQYSHGMSARRYAVAAYLPRSFQAPRTRKPSFRFGG